MAPSILLQREMQDARKSIQFCYICRQPLPPRSPRTTFRDLCSTEHIVPRSLLGKPRSSDWWPATLDVHKSCDATLKAVNDKALVDLQRINLEPPERWPSDLRLSQMIQSMDVMNVDGMGEVYTYQTKGNLLSAVRMWVQGLIVAIVREPVEIDEKNHLALPPVPAWKSDHENSLQFVVESSEIVDHGLRLGAKQGVISRLQAWGDSLRFQFAWILPRGHVGVCVWSLVYPGVHEWSRSVTGHAIPWHGLFIGPPPKGITPATFQK